GSACTGSIRASPCGTRTSRVSTGRLRDECLNVHHFAMLDHARARIELWREDYNDVRPHSSLGDLAPDEFVRCWVGGMPPTQQPSPCSLSNRKKRPRNSHRPWTEKRYRVRQTRAAHLLGVE